MTSMSLEHTGCHEAQKALQPRGSLFYHRHVALHIDHTCYMTQHALFLFSFVRLALYSVTMMVAPWVVPLLGFPCIEIMFTLRHTPETVFVSCFTDTGMFHFLSPKALGVCHLAINH